MRQLFENATNIYAMFSSLLLMFCLLCVVNCVNFIVTRVVFHSRRFKLFLFSFDLDLASFIGISTKSTLRRSEVKKWVEYVENEGIYCMQIAWVDDNEMLLLTEE